MVSDGSLVYSVGERGDLRSAGDCGGWQRLRAGSVERIIKMEAFRSTGRLWSNGSLEQTASAQFDGQFQFLAANRASDGNGRVTLVWQGFRHNQSVILGSLWDGKSWTPEQRVE